MGALKDLARMGGLESRVEQDHQSESKLSVFTFGSAPLACSMDQ